MDTVTDFMCRTASPPPQWRKAAGRREKSREMRGETTAMDTDATATMMKMTLAGGGTATAAVTMKETPAGGEGAAPDPLLLF